MLLIVFPEGIIRNVSQHQPTADMRLTIQLVPREVLNVAKVNRVVYPLRVFEGRTDKGMLNLWYTSSGADLLEVIEPKSTSGCNIQLRKIDYFNEEDLITKVGQMSELRTGTK
jgi:hypothetical protein